ncbi:DUF6396 domain-containing protein, partial [Aggregatibacter actinomycetemcomitans]|uniref:DUF6396 domain-containing protein n=1 Tax=Aggregatibacter actinomycetemcomitans TaxID=714 RepID=UPI001EF40444
LHCPIGMAKSPFSAGLKGAPLPDWDGKIAFQRWFEGKAPPKPSEALMFKLANQAGVRVDNGLDLQTDLPKAVKK